MLQQIPVRPRWHEWVIVWAILAICVLGIATLWGDAIRQLWHGEPERPRAPQVLPEVVAIHGKRVA